MTGVAAGARGQLLTADPVIVEEIIHEQISNVMPAAARDLLTGVHCHVLGYDNSVKRRPVGSLDAIVKVAQAYLLKTEKVNIDAVAEDMIDHAVGAKNGMTKIVSALKARVMCAIEQTDERFAVLKVDIKSAFPLSQRKKMRHAVRERLPSMLGIFDFLYGATNHHTFMTSDQGVCRVQQDQGIIQGYSHGPIASRLQEIENTTLKYADDFFLHGNVDEVTDLFDTLKKEYQEQTGLVFSQQKSELYMPAVTSEGVEMIEDRYKIKTTNQGMIALGVPLGGAGYTENELDKKAVTYKGNVERCAEICTRQATLTIMQHTASAYQHIVAALPPDDTQKFARRIDSINARVLRDNIFIAHI